MKYNYKTENTCAKEIEFELNGNVVTNVKFLKGGCPGNLQAVPKLVEGMTVEEIESKIGGIICGFRQTSCANELAKAVRKAYDSSTNNIKYN